MHPGIRDRFDLTLECIRRHYAAESANPLAAVLERYTDFFALFGDFRGYVEFFLLQDLVSADFEEVLFATPFDDFPTTALPMTVELYDGYRRHMEAFVVARNARIRSFASSASG